MRFFFKQKIRGATLIEVLIAMAILVCLSGFTAMVWVRLAGSNDPVSSDTLRNRSGYLLSRMEGNPFIEFQTYSQNGITFVGRSQPMDNNQFHLSVAVKNATGENLLHRQKYVVHYEN